MVFTKALTKRPVLTSSRWVRDMADEIMSDASIKVSRKQQYLAMLGYTVRTIVKKTKSPVNLDVKAFCTR